MTREGGRGRPTDRPGSRLAPLVVGILLLVLAIGGVLLWSSYGDAVEGTSLYEDTVETGPEPLVRLTNGLGRVSVEGVEGLENVEVTAQRHARGSDPTDARENAADVPVEISPGDPALEISSDGGGETGVEYALRVPSGSAVEVVSLAGDVEVLGLDNSVTVRAEGGDISVEDVRGSIEIEAPRGDVAISSVSTETGNAGITVGSGDVSLEDLVIGLLEARVEAGDVTLSGRFSGSGRIFVETGNINVQLPPEDAQDLYLEARVGEVLREDDPGSE